MVTVCEIRQVPDMAYLRAWATARGAPVDYLGVTLEGHPVYGATDGVHTRVCVVHTHRPMPPAVWRSPFEQEGEATNGAVPTKAPRTDRTTKRRGRAATSDHAARHVADSRVWTVVEADNS